MATRAKKSIKVLIADDHEIVRKGLRTILSDTNDIELVGEASDGHELLKLVDEQKADVVVLDYEMPNKNGLDTLHEMVRLYPKIPVVILSIFPEGHYGTRFLKAGAAGYLSKASASDQLVNAIRRVSTGGKYITPELADKLVTELHQDSSKPSHESLTDREFQVFCLLAKGMRLTDIADELLLSVNTVSTYRSRILEKMDLKTNADMIHYAIKNNLIK